MRLDALVLAHGGVEGALPMPLSLFVYALVAIVLVAYLALRLRPATVLPWPAGRLLPGWFQGLVKAEPSLLALRRISKADCTGRAQS